MLECCLKCFPWSQFFIVFANWSFSVFRVFGFSGNKPWNIFDPGNDLTDNGAPSFHFNVSGVSEVLTQNVGRSLVCRFSRPSVPPKESSTLLYDLNKSEELAVYKGNFVLSFHWLHDNFTKVMRWVGYQERKWIVRLKWKMLKTITRYGCKFDHVLFQFEFQKF